MTKSVAFCTLGCKVNQYETQALTELFIKKGYDILSFDKFSDDPVHEALVEVADKETVGANAVKRILIVSLDTEGEAKKAYLRNWTVIPDSEGDDVDAYTYSGTLKSNGKMIGGTATTTDDWLTCTFTAEDE